MNMGLQPTKYATQCAKCKTAIPVDRQCYARMDGTWPDSGKTKWNRYCVNCPPADAPKESENPRQDRQQGRAMEEYNGTILTADTKCLNCGHHVQFMFNGKLRDGGR